MEQPVIGHTFPSIVYNAYGVPILPPNWAEFRTPTGQPYWYNAVTRQSSWVFPMNTPQPIQPKKKKQIKKKIPSTQWLFVLTHDGYEFYYDRETKTSVWELPDQLKEPMELLKKQEEENKKKEEEEEQKKKALAEEERTKRVLEEEEEKAEQEAKRVKMEQEIVDDNKDNADQEHALENQLEATEMTEEDIMWQLQQMEEGQEEDDEEDNDFYEQDEQVEQEELEPKVETDNQPAQMSEEQYIEKFNELLKERNISPFSEYSQEYPDLMTDPRFSLVPHNRQKKLFNKYCNEMGEKLRSEKSNKKRPEDDFKELLQSKVTEKMYWDDFRRRFKADPRFKAITSTREKEALFKDHVKHNLGKKKTSPADNYMELLRNTREIRLGMRWRDAKKLLENDDRYYAIESKTEREDLFRDYLDSLDK